MYISIKRLVFRIPKAQLGEKMGGISVGVKLGEHTTLSISNRGNVT